MYLGIRRWYGRQNEREREIQNKDIHQLNPDEIQEYNFRNTTFALKIQTISQFHCDHLIFFSLHRKRIKVGQCLARRGTGHYFYSHLTYFKACIGTSVQKETHHCKISHAGSTHQGSPSKLKARFYAYTCQNLRY